MSCEDVNATDVLSVDAINSVELLAAAGLCSARQLLHTFSQIRLELFVVHRSPRGLEHDARRCVALNGGPCHARQGLISHESVHGLESPHHVSDDALQSRPVNNIESEGP